jgi:hypothetical protein
MLKQNNDHLKDSDMSYVKHFTHAYKNGLLLLVYAISSFIHGLIPALLPQHAPRGIIRMFYRFQKLPHLVTASEEEKHKTN